MQPATRSRPRSRRRAAARAAFAAAAAAALSAAALTGCAAGDDRDTAANTPTTQRLPPDGTTPVARLYDDRLRPLGWRVQRASMEHRPPAGAAAAGGSSTSSTSAPAPKRHFAVYLRPLGDPMAKDYVESLAATAKVFLPQVFDEYPELESFDVCLTPPEAEDPSAYPKTVSQVLVTREQVARFDWAAADPARIAAGGLGHPNALGLLLSPELRSSPEWQAAEAAAGIRR